MPLYPPPGGSGGTGTPGGGTNAIQYNAGGGAFGGDNTITYEAANSVYGTAAIRSDNYAGQTDDSTLIHIGGSGATGFFLCFCHGAPIWGAVNDHGLGLNLPSNYPIGWNPFTGTVNNSLDVALTRGGPGALQQGLADAASPAAQTLQVQSVAAGNANVAGKDWTLRGSLPTGAGAPGNINVNTSYSGTAGPTAVTITLGSPAVFNATNHGFFPGQTVLISTTGSLPTGVSTLTTYWVDAFGGLTANSFQLRTAITGGNVAASGTQSGVHTVTPGGVVGISIGSPAVFSLTNHSLAAGQVIQLQTTGALPTGLSVGTNYYVLGDGTLNINTFQVSATLGGSPVNTSGTQSGTQTFTVNQTSTQQNPASTTVKIGPSQQNALMAVLPALTLNQSFFGTELVGNRSMFQLNATGNLYNSVNFLQFSGNGAPRYITGYQPGPGAGGAAFQVQIAAIGESIIAQMRQQGNWTSLDLRVDSSQGNMPLMQWGDGTSNLDTYLSRPNPANWQLGNYDSATPIAQTLSIQSAAVGNANVSGVLGTIRGSVSTGIGEPGFLTFNTHYVGYDVNKNVTISNASPAVLTTSGNHNLASGQSVLLQTTGTLPAPFAPLTMYWIDKASLTATTFELAASWRGTPINSTTAGSGTHSYVLGGVINGMFNFGPGGSTLFQTPDLCDLLPGMPVQFQSSGTLPTGISPATTYYVCNTPSATLFLVSATPGGAPITVTGGTGTLTYTLQGGGTGQNIAPPNYQSFTIGPSSLHGNDGNSFVNFIQNWNTSNEGAVGQAALIAQVNNMRDVHQITRVAQFEDIGSLNVFDFRTERTPTYKSWIFSPGDGDNGPPAIEFHNANWPDLRLSLVGQPVEIATATASNFGTSYTKQSVYLYNDAVNGILSIINPTIASPAGLRIYNSTDEPVIGTSTGAPVNFSRGKADWTTFSNIFTVGTDNGGTGTAYPLNLQSATGTIMFQAGYGHMGHQYTTMHGFEIGFGGVLGNTPNTVYFSDGSIVLTGAGSASLDANGNWVVSPAGSSTSAPRIVGVSGFTTGTAACFRFGDPNNQIQCGFGTRQAWNSYWGIDIRGNQEGTTAPFTVGSASDPNVTIFGSAATGPHLALSNSNSTNLSYLSAEANNILALRSTANPQGLRIYNTADDASANSSLTNYERGALDWNLAANIFAVGTQAAGTGTARDMHLFGWSSAGGYRIKSNVNGNAGLNVRNAADTADAWVAAGAFGVQGGGWQVGNSQELFQDGGHNMYSLQGAGWRGAPGLWLNSATAMGWAGNLDADGGGKDTTLFRAAAGVMNFSTSPTTNSPTGWFNYGGQSRVTSDFSVTSSTTLTNVTGLSVNVQAGRTYKFSAQISWTDAAAGGIKAAIAGTCTATNIIYDGWIIDSGANGIKGNAQGTALGATVANAATTGTAGHLTIEGTITVNAAGTLTVQIAQSVSNATATVAKQGSTFIVQDMP